MLKPKHIFFIFLLIFCPKAFALSFKDQDLEKNQALNPIKLSEVYDKTEFHWDAILSSDWTDGVAGRPDSNNRVFVDYRVEAHTPLYNHMNQRGRLITRVAGIAFLDENIKNFFDDPLIDIPEIFLQNDTTIKNNDLRFVFGKFADRRFFNKDEINADQFDIGEMRFSGAIGNTLNLFNRINEFRDNEYAAIGTRIATGSYGFNFGIKNKNTNGSIFNRWGFQQALAVSQLDDFSKNFYGISEINKDWGSTKPGRLSTGLVYANDQVFQLSGSTDASYLIYVDLAQKVTDKLKAYFRYGSLFKEIDLESSTDNEYRIGLIYDLTKKLSSHIWLGYFDGNEKLSENDRFIQMTNILNYKLADNLLLQGAAVLRFDQFSSAASNSQDNSFTLAVHLRYFD